jgi:regulator of cell morphogenesis and NO signaling
MVITTETTVRDIALEEPTAISVLEQFGIDYCCGGKSTLAEACAKSNQDVGPGDRRTGTSKARNEHA